MLFPRLPVTVLLLCLALPSAVGGTEAPAWRELTRDHFAVYYLRDRSFAQRTVRTAEQEYARINRELGFQSLVKARHLALWLWDDRCKIYLYPSKESYHAGTGAPEWSSGQVNYETRVMWSYSGAESFLSSTLPHEIAHILFRELVGPENPHVPRWLDEGIAQYAERDQRRESIRFMARQVAAGSHFSLGDLNRLSPDRLPAAQARLYYAQAASVVHFLLERYGKGRFADLLANLRDGYPVERALSFATGAGLESLEDLEGTWIRFLQLTR